MSTPSDHPPVPAPSSRLRVPADELAEPFDPLPTDRHGEADEAPPRTGEPEVDQALEGVMGLGSLPLGEHTERLARAHEALHTHLQDPPRDDARG